MNIITESSKLKEVFSLMLPVIALFTLTLNVFGADENIIPVIRYTAEPAIVNGEPKEKIWQNADTFSAL